MVPAVAARFFTKDPARRLHLRAKMVQNTCLEDFFMKDTRAMAYVNMYGVLGALENLCALDAVAREILAALKRPFPCAST